MNKFLFSLAVMVAVVCSVSAECMQDACKDCGKSVLQFVQGMEDIPDCLNRFVKASKVMEVDCWKKCDKRAVMHEMKTYMEEVKGQVPQECADQLKVFFEKYGKEFEDKIIKNQDNNGCGHCLNKVGEMVEDIKSQIMCQ